jgi:hypothetical protein
MMAYVMLEADEPTIHVDVHFNLWEAVTIFHTTSLSYFALFSRVGVFLFADMVCDLKSLQPYSVGISQFYSGWQNCNMEKVLSSYKYMLQS